VKRVDDLNRNLVEIIQILSKQNSWSQTPWPPLYFPSKEPAPNSVPCRGRRKWQRDRVVAAVKKLYPPNGSVPAHISPAIVRRQITAELEPECRKFHISLPSRDTVNLALRELRALEHS
jgi:hypothetical protein